MRGGLAAAMIRLAEEFAIPWGEDQQRSHPGDQGRWSGDGKVAGSRPGGGNSSGTAGTQEGTQPFVRTPSLESQRGGYGPPRGLSGSRSASPPSPGAPGTPADSANRPGTPVDLARARASAGSGGGSGSQSGTPGNNSSPAAVVAPSAGILGARQGTFWHGRGCPGGFQGCRKGWGAPDSKRGRIYAGRAENSGWGWARSAAPERHSVVGLYRCWGDRQWVHSKPSRLGRCSAAATHQRQFWGCARRGTRVRCCVRAPRADDFLVKLLCQGLWSWQVGRTCEHVTHLE